MGQQKTQLYALVSMANNDVYYIDEVTYYKLLGLLKNQADGHIMFTDAKSFKAVTISVKQISSVVELGAQNA